MSNECFIISPIGEEGSSIRRHADQLLRHIIRPTVERFDYESSRADQLAEPGLITQQIIQKLINSHLVIADLTQHYPNVFYELAIRHAAHLPVIHMARAGEKLPFDIAGFRTIFFDLSNPDSIVEAKDKLSQQIQSVAEGRFESPLSTLINPSKLQASQDPQARTLADVLLNISDLQLVVESPKSPSEIMVRFGRVFAT